MVDQLTTLTMLHGQNCHTLFHVSLLVVSLQFLNVSDEYSHVAEEINLVDPSCCYHDNTCKMSIFINISLGNFVVKLIYFVHFSLISA